MSITAALKRFFGPKPTPSQLAYKRVLNVLKGKADGAKIAQAQARAARSVRAGVHIDEAVNRARMWALNATDHFNRPAC
jgi:hypothetical protein